MYYKHSNTIGIRRKFSLKDQCMSFGGKKVKLKEKAMKAHGEKVLERLHQGDSEGEVKAWIRNLMDGFK